MAQTTIEQFATELKMPAGALLEQLPPRASRARSRATTLTEQDKTRLLDYLRKQHGAAGDGKKRITLTRKQTTEIKAADSSGKARTIQVEVRKKRVLVRREEEAPVDAARRSSRRRRSAAATGAGTGRRRRAAARGDRRARGRSAQGAGADGAPAGGPAEEAGRSREAQDEEGTRSRGSGRARRRRSEGRRRREGRRRGRRRGGRASRPSPSRKARCTGPAAKPGEKREKPDEESAGPGVPGRGGAPARAQAARRHHGRRAPPAGAAAKGGRHGRDDEDGDASGAQSAQAGPMVREISVPETITVADLAHKMSVKAAEVIKALMKLGTMVTINQVIDQETAMIVVEEMGHKAKAAKLDDPGLAARRDRAGARGRCASRVRRSSRSWATSTTARRRCSTRSAARAWRAAKRAASRSTSAPITSRRRKGIDHVPRHAGPRGVHGDARARRQGHRHRRAGRRGRRRRDAADQGSDRPREGGATCRSSSR